MAIVGLGTDIVEVSRLTKLLKKPSGAGFARRVLTEDELTEFELHARPDRYLAKRFAIKEAASKALGTGIGRGVSFQHISYEHDENGKPLLVLNGGAKQRAESLGARHYHLSLSDEADYVVATAIIES